MSPVSSTSGKESGLLVTTTFEHQSIELSVCFFSIRFTYFCSVIELISSANFITDKIISYTNFFFTTLQQFCLKFIYWKFFITGFSDLNEESLLRAQHIKCIAFMFLCYEFTELLHCDDFFYDILTQVLDL